MFLKKIKNKINNKIACIEYLRESTLPLVIYGAGSYAIDVHKLIDKYGIKIEAAFVDVEYLGSVEYLSGNIKVTTLETICNMYDKFNVLIGYSDYKHARNRLSNIKSVATTILIDAPPTIEFFDYQYIVNNLDDFNYTYNLLHDQLSKDTFIAYINAKISGQPDELYNLVDKNQYFNELIAISNDEIYIDCGAYDGDTVLKFIKKASGLYEKIYAIEPEKNNYLKLKQLILENQIKNIKFINKGCWDSKSILRFQSGGNMTSLISDQGESIIEVDTIDNMLDNRKATFIKMDIEGAELAALRGAEKTIIESKPKLAICVYHKPEDLITIPQYISSILKDYKYFLRHHQYVSWDTVLYAIPQVDYMSLSRLEMPELQSRPQ